LNVAKILDRLREVEYVNAIFLVVNGAQVKATATLEYVLSQLSAFFPKGTMSNFFVVWTHIPSPLHKSFPVDNMAKALGFYPRPENEWYLVNPSCLYKRASPEQLADPKTIEFFVEEYTRVSVQALKVYEIIAKMKPIHTRHFIELAEKKENIEIQIYKGTTILKESMQKKKEMEELRDSLGKKGLQKKAFSDFQLTRTIKKKVPVKTEYHNTICAECNSNCHIRCGLTETMEKGHNIFRDCTAMGGSDVCRVCGHSYREHYHWRSKFEEQVTTESYVDENMKTQFDEADSNEKKFALAIEVLTNKAQELEKKLIVVLENLTQALQEYQSLTLGYNYKMIIEKQRNYVKQMLETYPNQANSLKESLIDFEHRLELLANTTVVIIPPDVTPVPHLPPFPDTTSDEISILQRVLNNIRKKIFG